MVATTNRTSGSPVVADSVTFPLAGPSRGDNQARARRRTNALSRSRIPQRPVLLDGDVTEQEQGRELDTQRRARLVQVLSALERREELLGILHSTTTEVNLRDVSNYSSPTLGQTLCLNGKTTHSHCAQVRKVSVCSNGACNLVQMSIRVSEDGDSGGPWYSGNVAYGIHKGWQCDPSWPFDRSIFTRVTRLDEGLGVVVATS